MYENTFEFRWVVFIHRPDLNTAATIALDTVQAGGQDESRGPAQVPKWRYPYTTLHFRDRKAHFLANDQFFEPRAARDSLFTKVCLGLQIAR